MKVLKFGGTSVGTSESLLKVKKIVESTKGQTVVVVSALGGLTDRLISTSRMAEAGDLGYRKSFEEIVKRHHDIVEDVIIDSERKEALTAVLNRLLGELDSIFQGVFLIRDLSEKTMNAILSYGERLSSQIVAALISGAKWYDSLSMIKTQRKHHRTLLQADLTESLVKESLGAFAKGEEGCRVALLGGFISEDCDTGEITNLGRGGSDYTASIIAGALDAEVLEIWTDVDGFMTADPRVIDNAYTIQSLTYREATELCNFGAKVVYPPTIYPVCVKDIPILVKNTFRPEAPGTFIGEKRDDDDRPIKGISSIGDTSIINVSGLSMVGVIGVNRRIFTALADEGISVFMVSQASSENSTSIGVREEDAALAAEVLNAEFAKEIEMGAMYEMQVERGLATVAVVGENMQETPGCAGKLFGALGRSGINVVATAQGASQTNISFIVRRDSLRKTLNTIHDSFFLSEYKVLNLFICGVGTVGGSLLDQIAGQRERLMKERSLKLNVVGIASGHHAMFSRDGIDLTNWREQLAAAPATDNKRLLEEVTGMNIFNSVFVDCTASPEVADLYHDFFEHNISVVAANKVAASSDYANYERLKHTALRRGVKFLFETNVGAGLPIINTINDLRNSGDTIQKIEAVLSGTLNFIFNTLSEEVPLSMAVRQAKEKGYSEPDPRIDLSGKDVLRKLVILSREAGFKINQEDVLQNLCVPHEVLEGSMDDFWQRLADADASMERGRQEVEKNGKRWRYVARLEDGRGSVGLQEIAEGHPFYNLEGSNNIILLTTERYHDYPMRIQGYGAGADVTAAGVFADIMSIANI